MKRLQWIAWLLVLTLMTGLMAGCAKSAEEEQKNALVPEQQADQPKQEANSGKEPPVALAVRTASSYDEILVALREIQQRSDQLAYNGMDQMESAEDDAAAEAPAEGGMGDYSETNIQVDGVDEADIVKTDGQYLYLLREGEINIVKADGAKTAEVGKIIQQSEGETGNSYRYASGMYLYGNVLAVVAQYGSWSYFDNGVSVGEDLNRAELLLYDISNPAAPQLLDSFQQDGNYVDSRMTDGVVYLVSTYYVYAPNEETPELYIPKVCSDDGEELLAADEIFLCPEPASNSYSVVTSIDMEGDRRLSQQAVLGASSGCYMSRENLYLYGTSYVQEDSESRQEAQYTVVDHTERVTTTLMRFALSDGMAVLEADGQVDGGLLNQFSLDEYNGYLRLAVTNNNWSYQIYTDDAYGFVNYVYPEDGYGQSNSLYILDQDLQTVGTLEGFGLDERIYSARFLGETGYVVTFRETDPLFAIDLSDPQNPSLLSELKITGFSSYLHPYGEHMLVGIGMEADPETGATSGMKLSMFDISDPGDVAVLDTAQMDDTWSAVLYDHKAALIDAEKNLIAFPGNGRYLLYRFSEGDGFSLLGEFADDSYGSGIRGIYIDGYLYVCTLGGVTVADLQTMEQVGRVDMAFG